jgi:hypothetical protein
MLQMDLPHLNVLTKIDELSTYGPLPFYLDFYTEVQDLSYLLPHLQDESSVMAGSKFEGLNTAIVELVESFGLVGFETLAIEDKRSMMHLLQVIDRAGGYAFGDAEGANDTVWQVAMREGVTTMNVKDVQERWLDAKDEYDQKEREDWAEQAKIRDEAERAKAAQLAEEDDDDDDLGGMPMPAGGSGMKIIRKNQ